MATIVISSLLSRLNSIQVYFTRKTKSYLFGFKVKPSSINDEYKFFYHGKDFYHWFVKQI